jgi:lipopolysaccharide transport system permease protein
VMSLIKNRQIFLQIAKREVEKRYRGTVLGLLWAVITPLIMLSIYTVVFGFIFGGSFGRDESRMEFAMALFSGLLIFELFAAALTQSPGTIIQNPNYVKKVVFPLEVLPPAMLAATAVHTVIGLIPLVGGLLIAQGSIQPTIFWLPLIFVPVLLYCVGIWWFLSALGVFLRDIANLVVSIQLLVLFASAIFYPPSMAPQELQIFFILNPIAVLAELARNATVFGITPPFQVLGVQILLAFLAALLGRWFFIKTKPAFADVI